MVIPVETIVMYVYWWGFVLLTARVIRAVIVHVYAVPQSLSDIILLIVLAVLIVPSLVAFNHILNGATPHEQDTKRIDPETRG